MVAYLNPSNSFDWLNNPTKSIISIFPSYSFDTNYSTVLTSIDNLAISFPKSVLATAPD